MSISSARFFFFLPLLLLVACGDERPLGCPAGAQEACFCADGVSFGQRTCGANGTYGACLACATKGPELGDMGSETSKYVASSLVLPKSNASAAYDIDGNGTLENRLGAILQALMALGLDAQAGADAAVVSGQVVILLEQTSTDPAQQSAQGASVVVSKGMPSSAPRFDGSDVFMVDTSTNPAHFVGDIVAGTYSSEDPATATSPVTLTIAVPLVPGQPPIALPITAARITFKRTSSGSLTAGQLNGAVRKADVDSVILPVIAALLTDQLHQPGGSAALQMFDPNQDGVVTAAEIKSNAIVAGLMAPDLDLFDASGNYAPNPAKTDKDSLSLGLSFTAAQASY